ncbi:MAG: hypothetical protein LBQ35_08205 [Spirochaetaceae bacterium]|jgi:hypothetical protein|nr:hypothetical protein [Spirochaetaceae bacterium]
MSKKSPLTLILALLCLGAYVFALSWGAYRVFVNIKSNRALAERDFYQLREELSSRDPRSFMGTAYRQGIEDAITRSTALLAVIISSPDGSFAFERERAAVVNWVDDSPRFAKRFGVAAQPLFSPLDVEGRRNVNLHAVYAHIEYGDFLSTLRFSLLIVLGALAAAFLCLILEAAMDKREAAASAPSGDRAPEDDFFGDAELAAGDAGGEELPDLGGDDGEADFGFSGEPESAEEAGLGDTDFGDFGDIDTPEAERDDGAEAPATPPPPPAPAKSLEEGERYNRYGVRRGTEALGQIASELEKAQRYREDLSLMVLRYGNPDDPEGVWYADFVRIAVDAYTIRDLIFENGDRGLVVIIPNTDLDRAIARAQEFRRLLPSTFTQSLDMGLSARAGREVPAERLLLEASHAAKRASGEPSSPIVAFKSDPEKYRAFMQGR